MEENELPIAFAYEVVRRGGDVVYIATIQYAVDGDGLGYYLDVPGKGFATEEEAQQYADKVLLQLKEVFTT